MDGQNGNVSRVFRELADVFETFETEQTELAVTHATPVDDNLLDTETVSVEVGTRIPFLEHVPESASDTGISLTPTDAHLDTDGSLHVELQATAGYCCESDQSEGEGRSEDQTGGDDAGPKPTATTETDTTDKKQSDRRDTRPSAEASNCDESATAETTADDDEQARKDSDTRGDSDSDVPPYRDPERLREVYEKYDTFGEMTEALGADVTSQTVRRYMIKQDIHTPASKTGSHSAEMLLDMDPDSITKRTPDGEPADGEDTIHPNNRRTPTFQKPT